MDVYKFKSISEKYGHPVVDAMKKTDSGVLRDAACGSDFIARCVGEEFAVGTVETACRGAYQMGEQIRKIQEKTAVDRVYDVELRVAVSIGISSFPEDTKNAADLVTMSDDALYHAKRSGRNSVCLRGHIDASGTDALSIRAADVR